MFIKTTDDTTTDSYVAQGMYVCMCAYICKYIFIGAKTQIVKGQEETRLPWRPTLKCFFIIWTM